MRPTRSDPSGRAGTSVPGLPPAARAHVLRLLFWGALAVQVYLLYLYPAGDDGGLPLPHLDKLVHAVMFMVPAALGVLLRFPPWLVGVALAAHAVASELVQYFWLPARGGDPWDVVADWIGVILGLAAGRLLVRAAPTAK